MDRNVIFFPEDDQEFEAMCCSIAKEKYADYNAQQYGRSGQKQWGIDIKATDRRHNNERVVIQCKFKHDPPKFSGTRAEAERKAITNELEKEINQALNAPGFGFEIFIYAANIPNDKDIEDFAVALEKTCGKKVIVWTWDSIQKDISHHPRLTRLYSESKNRLGVEIIDQDFIDGLNEAIASKQHQPSVFQFYTGIQAKQEQWHGIVNNWDAPRDCFQNIESQVDFLFSKPYRESKVVAVVYGEGGSGKSTVLRRMAIHAVQNEKPYVVWWVEDLNAFLEFDANSIQSAHKQKHLVIIEDWYRNVGEKGKDATQAKAFFTWLKHCDHVLVLIGDRKKDGFYQDYVFESKYIKLTGSEHHYILKRMASVSPIFKGILGQFKDNANLIDHSSLFVILYIIANISQEKGTNSQVEIGDIDARFKSIVRKKLSSLESMPEYRGLGRAIHLCAKIYTDEKIANLAFSEKALLLTAQYFGKNVEIIDRIENAGEYPIESKSIFYIQSTFSQLRKKAFNYIRFNHDIIPEQGIAFEDEHFKGLEAFDFLKLIKILENEEQSTALMLWNYLYGHKINEEKHFDYLLKVVTNHSMNIHGGVLDPVYRNLNEQNKLEFAKIILNNPNFENPPKEIVSTALNLLGMEREGKEAAKRILNNPNFEYLPIESVSSALNVLVKEGKGKEAAKRILNNPNFENLPHQIVSHALNILGKERGGKEAAKRILNNPNFEYLPKEIVSHALNILGKEGEGKEAAKRILNNPNFENLPHSIVSTALNILGKEGEGKEAAKRILKSKKEVNSFLLFSAIKSLSLSSSNTDRALVSDIYNWLSNEINRSKGLFRLYFDFFYLPLFFIPKHVNRVKPLLANYNPQGINVKTNYNIYQILRCFEEYYFEIGHLKPDVKIVCTTILQNWKAIIQWQRISNPDEIQTGHIKIALGHPELRKMAKNAAPGIVQFCELEENHVFLDSNLYEVAKIIRDFDVYREWGEDEPL